MAKRGTQVFWTINNDLETTAEKIEALGFGKFCPRNDYKSALIKSLKKYTKGIEKDYRDFNETPDRVSYGIFVEFVSQDDISMRKEVIVNLAKNSGVIDFVVPHGVPFDDRPIREAYRHGKDTINADQVRSIVTKFIRRTKGISMRPTGGIYFFDARHDEGLHELRRLFSEFPRSMTLYETVLHDDAATLQTIEGVVNEELVNRVTRIVDEFQDEFNKGTLTKKKLEFKKDEAEKLLSTVKDQAHNLRAKAAAITVKVEQINQLLSKRLAAVEGSMVDEGEFADLLRML